MNITVTSRDNGQNLGTLGPNVQKIKSALMGELDEGLEMTSVRYTAPLPSGLAAVVDNLDSEVDEDEHLGSALTLLDTSFHISSSEFNDEDERLRSLFFSLTVFLLLALASGVVGPLALGKASREVDGITSSSFRMLERVSVLVFVLDFSLDCK